MTPGHQAGIGNRRRFVRPNPRAAFVAGDHRIGCVGSSTFLRRHQRRQHAETLSRPPDLDATKQRRWRWQSRPKAGSGKSINDGEEAASPRFSLIRECSTDRAVTNGFPDMWNWSSHLKYPARENSVFKARIDEQAHFVAAGCTALANVL